jgi:hypothetical protein
VVNVDPCILEFEETVLCKCNISVVNMALISQLYCSTGKYGMQVFRNYIEVCQTIQTPSEPYWYGKVDVAPT